LAVAFAAASFSASAADGCGTNAMRRVVVGPQPTANALYAHIQHVDMGSWQTGFDEETFVYIGEVHTNSGKTYKIGHLKTSWGPACRATQRLFIFDAGDRYLGQYAPVVVDAKHIRIQGSALLFPFDPQDGNKLDLKEGPPPKAWLDGDNPEWTPAPAAPTPGTAPPPPGKGL